MKIKDSHLDKNSYTGGEIYFQMLSVRFLAGEWLDVGRTAVSIIIMWPAYKQIFA